MSVKVFYSSVTGSQAMKKNQQRVFDVLSSNKINFEIVDIAQNSKDKDLMRQMAGNPTALPPQIFNGNVYCGDMAAFENAIEMEELNEFLGLQRKS